MFGLSAFDIIVILGVISSAAIGVRRGFTTEAMKLVTWAGAIFITFVLKPAATALFSTFITAEFMAQIVGMVVVFIATLIALNFLGKFIGDRIKSSFIGPVDRLLGAIFGGLRGAVVVCALFLVFSQFFAKKDYPDWMRGAKLLPYIEIGAIVIAEVTPDLFEDAADAVKGYNDQAREEMDDLVEDAADDT